MLDWYSETGAGLLSGLLKAALLVGPAFAGAKVYDRTKNKWLGWGAGIGLFILGALLFYDATEKLDALNCRSASDFDLCMNSFADSDPY